MGSVLPLPGASQACVRVLLLSARSESDMSREEKSAVDRRDAFSDFHPAVCFAFFVLAITFCMVLRHPAFTASALVLSFLYALTVQGFPACKLLLAMMPIFLIVSAVNPIFNTMGQTVLFTYLDGRPYTFEALAYGACTACAFVAMFIWFSSYNRVMTSDKFTFLFGGLAPAITLTLTMALRLVPTYLSKLRQFSHCRSSLGKSVQEGTFLQRASHGADLLSQLTTWAFENAVQTADSMKSRGYGVGARTQFSLYRITTRDVICIAAMVVLSACTVAGMAAGSQDIEFYPTIVAARPDALFISSLCAYCALLFLPTFINVKEIVLWRSSLLKM